MSYASMAEALGITYCRGILPTGHYCYFGDHEAGFVTNTVVHYRDRPRSWANTHAFLKLAARAHDPSIKDGDVLWRRTFLTGRTARDLGGALGVRVPSRYWSTEKALVLAGVAGLRNDVPYRKEAFDWARRTGRSR